MNYTVYLKRRITQRLAKNQCQRNMNRILIFLGVVVLLGCEYDDLNTCIDPSKRNPHAACPEVIMPVCGCDGVTYENSCVAENAGVLQWTNGNCPQ
jgi:hypothetical protein